MVPLSSSLSCRVGPLSFIKICKTDTIEILITHSARCAWTGRVLIIVLHPMRKHHNVVNRSRRQSMPVTQICKMHIGIRLRWECNLTNRVVPQTVVAPMNPLVLHSISAAWREPQVKRTVCNINRGEITLHSWHLYKSILAITTSTNRHCIKNVILCILCNLLSQRLEICMYV